MICSNVDRASALLLAGRVVAIPTETVYGLAGNAYNEQAVATIFNIKGRPLFDPLIVHTDSIEKVKGFVEAIPAKAFLLAESFWPGPLTLILPKKKIISDLITAGSAYVAVRIPNHPIALQLLSSLPFPLVAPSANPFGYVSPTTAQHVADQLGDQMDMILDGGRCSIGIESTIVSFMGETPVICRLGGIDRVALESVVGTMDLSLQQAPHRPYTPGTLLSHYAPKKKMILGDLSASIARYTATKRLGILSFQEKYPAIPQQNQIILSPKGCVQEAASNLFNGLRILDGLPIDLILADYLPNIGIGEAINDRLRRAANV